MTLEEDEDIKEIVPRKNGWKGSDLKQKDYTEYFTDVENNLDDLPLEGHDLIEDGTQIGAELSDSYLDNLDKRDKERRDYLDAEVKGDKVNTTIKAHECP